MIKKIATGGNRLVDYSLRRQVEATSGFMIKKIVTGGDCLADCMWLATSRRQVSQAILQTSLVNAASRGAWSLISEAKSGTILLLFNYSPRRQVSQASLQTSLASLLVMHSSLVKRFALFLHVQVIEIIEKIVKHECKQLVSYWSRFQFFFITSNAASHRKRSMIKTIATSGNRLVDYTPRLGVLAAVATPAAEPQVTVQTSLAARQGAWSMIKTLYRLADCSFGSGAKRNATASRIIIWASPNKKERRQVSQASLQKSLHLFNKLYIYLLWAILPQQSIKEY